MLVQGSNKQAQKVITKSCNDLVIRFPFAGLLILGQFIRVVQSHEHHTLATDGRTIFCNPDYVLAVYEKEGLRGVIFRMLHEYFHIYFNHVDRAQHRVFEVWNIAIDIVDNRMVEEVLGTERDPWPTPLDGIQHKGWEAFETAEKIYDELVRQQQQPNPPPLPSPVANPYCEEGDNEFGGQDLLPSPFETEAEKQDWQDGVTEAICQAHAVMEMNPLSPDLPGPVYERLVSIKEGRVPWARLLTGRLLADLPGNIATFSPPRRRLYPKLILPRYKSPREKELILLEDVSGSVGERLLSEFKAATYPAARRADKIHIVAFDSKVREIMVTKRATDVKKFKYKSGRHSHTSVIEAFDYVRKVRPSAIACLTDGGIRLPPYEPLFGKTIFCLPRGGIKQPWGVNFIMDIAW